VEGRTEVWLRNFWMSAKWMVITVLAPEVLIMLNTGQLFSAKKTVKRLKEFAEQDSVPWSLTHSLFANMGGFVVREHAPERVVVSPRLHAQSTRGETEIAEGDTRSGEGIKTVNEDPSGAKDESTGNLEAQPRPEPRTFFLLPHDILKLRMHNVIKLPYITRDEIMDKGKSDSFARLIAIAQTLWLAVQMIVRASRHLEVSQLEIGTVAFASCAITLYTLNWHKPRVWVYR
jgi:hypothetical protein